MENVQEKSPAIIFSRDFLKTNLRSSYEVGASCMTGGTSGMNLSSSKNVMIASTKQAPAQISKILFARLTISAISHHKDKMHVAKIERRPIIRLITHSHGISLLTLIFGLIFYPPFLF